MGCCVVAWFETDQLVIAGKTVAGRGMPLPVENPATEQVFTHAPTVDAEQV